MKIIRIALAFLFLQCAASAQDTLSTKEPKWKQLSQAYGFLLGQKFTIDRIAEEYPELSPEIKESWLAFNSCALGESGKSLEEAMEKEYGAQWPELKKQMESQLSESLGKQPITKMDASAFLKEVKSRAKGQLPASLRSSLLSVHPRYTRNPSLEIAEGWTQNFSSKGHPKANGIDFSIQMPASWVASEGNRPNIVQNFKSEAGHGPVMSTIIVKHLGLPAGYVPTHDEIRDFLKPSDLKDIVPAGGVYISSESIVLESLPAAILVFDITQQRVDVKMEMRFTKFIVFHAGSMITIQFAVTKMPKSENTIDELQKKYLPAYKSIANTFVLNDKYK